MNWDEVAAAIGVAEGRDFRVDGVTSVGGGCINRAYRIEGGGSRYFVKTNRAELADMFAAESAALQEMAETSTVKVPRAVAHGAAAGHSFLVLEWLALGAGRRGSQAVLGRHLAELHGRRQLHYGWSRDNTIGSSPQKNPPCDAWGEFWGRWRLGFQLELAAEQGYKGRLQSRGEALCAKLDGFFAGYAPQPSLLHGDLWGGNAGCDDQGNPVIFDPASYYGDREADMAMTELFGGFGGDFYSAYNEAWPLEPGYGVRKNLYNLYHILNHLNLFGGGYLSQAQSMIDRVLAELG